MTMTMIYFYFGYLCITTFLHMIYDNSPFSLIAPSFRSYVLRIRAILKPSLQITSSSRNYYYHMPNRIRIYLLIRIALKLVLHPLSDVMWLLDEILFPSYRKQAVSNPIFIVGGFRTGSTSLHRALHSSLVKGSSSTVTSPRFVELFLPFLTVQYLFDYLERSKRGTSILIQRLQQFFLQHVMGDALAEQHPMDWHDPEEDDILLAKWHYTGWYTMFMFPDVLLLQDQNKNTVSSSLCMKRSIQFYKHTMQKILWRRGGRDDDNDCLLLCKNHFIHFVPFLQEAFPNARFIFLVRHPKYTIPSLYSLAQHALKRFALEPLLPIPLAVHAHFNFWDQYTAEEIKLYHSNNSTRHAVAGNANTNDTNSDKMMSCWIRHSDYVNNPEMVVNKSIIVDFLGMAGINTELLRQTREEPVARMKNTIVCNKHRNMHVINNVVTEQSISEHYKTYIEMFRLEHT